MMRRKTGSRWAFRYRLHVEPFAVDPRLVPPGKSVLKVVMAASFVYWQEPQRTPERYRVEKQRIADSVALLEQRFLDFRRADRGGRCRAAMTTLLLIGNRLSRANS